MLETMVFMMGSTLLFIGYMAYTSKQVKVRTEAYLKHAKKTNDIINKAIDKN